MSKIYQARRLLIEKVFEKGKNTLNTEAKNNIAEHFELELDVNYNYAVSAKTLVRCYDNLHLGKKINYRFKDNLAWDFLSKLIGYKNFDDFYEKEFKQTLISENGTTVLEEILHNLVIIKDSISLVVHNFSLKKSGFGIVGLVFVLGLVLNKFNFFKCNEMANISNQSDTGFLVKKNKNSPIVIPQQIVYIPQEIKEISKNNISTEAKKQCMYWNGEFYVEIFCNELIEGKEIIALSEEKKLLKKITRPDTLTVENALGKVWYDKSNNKVEFFTHYGKHPENGKALKDVSETILEKYAKK